MNGQQMWFGTRGHERWVKAPQTGADFSRKKFSSQLNFLNGGAAILGSRASHAEYNMSWPVASRLDLRAILDFAGRLYDNDPLAKYMVPANLIYFVDPMEMELNLAPISWGSPMLAATDAPSLLADARPDVVATDANTAGYPSFSAEYAITAASVPRSFYLPIPPGYKLWAGFHGSATGAGGVQVTPAGGAPTKLTALGLGQTRVQDSFAGATGVDIQLVGNAGDTIKLTALILQLIKTSFVPDPGGYISGRGHSGCAFADEPQVVALSTVNHRAEVSGAAKLVEVGAWL
ncbi:hypothetical protein [Pseudolysinimonas sp.]|uniref:hypothetical protein n=1 Tax=Pseudolysinimonas sp. TaxID=2680009 RepID=UPI003F821522